MVSVEVLARTHRVTAACARVTGPPHGAQVGTRALVAAMPARVGHHARLAGRCACRTVSIGAGV